MKPRSTVDLVRASRPHRVQVTTPYCRAFHNLRVVASSPYRQLSRPNPTHQPQRWLRYASSAAAAKRHSSEPSTLTTKSHVPAISPTSSLRDPQIHKKLNPPDETYAPNLVIPDKTPDQSRIKYIYQCGKQYIQFYKQGITNVRSTSKLAKTLRAKQARKGSQDKSGLGILTRAEWQIVRRSRRDTMRLPAMAVLVLVFGEWLPLFALYLTPLIPEPCRIPKQTHRTLEKSEIRRKERERRLALNAPRLVAKDRKPGITSTGVVAPNAVHIDTVKNMDLFSLLTLSVKLDCHSRVWDWLFLTPPKGALRWGLRRKLEYLKRDDGLIERDGGLGGLSEREVRRACMERGVRVLGRKVEDLRRELAAWFKR